MLKGWCQEGSEVGGAGIGSGRGRGGKLKSDAGGRASSMAGPAVLTRRESSMVGSIDLERDQVVVVAKGEGMEGKI